MGHWAKIGRSGLAAFACFSFAVGALAAREIPPLTGPVIDEAGLLSRRQLAALEEELRAFPPEMQLQIWIVPSLEGESIEALSIRAAEKWKLGTAKEDRGALILVSPGDRQMRIEIGQGLEGEIPDAAAGRIVDGVLRPAFRRESYYAGLRQASELLYARAGGDLGKLPGTEASSGEHREPRSGSVLLAVFVLFVLFSVLGPLFLPALFVGSGMRRRGGWGGGGGWSGGGGGWSGGGGGFSGGGSSGNW